MTKPLSWPTKLRMSETIIRFSIRNEFAPGQLTHPGAMNNYRIRRARHAVWAILRQQFICAQIAHFFNCPVETVRAGIKYHNSAVLGKCKDAIEFTNNYQV